MTGGSARPEKVLEPHAGRSQLTYSRTGWLPEGSPDATNQKREQAKNNLSGKNMKWVPNRLPGVIHINTLSTHRGKLPAHMTSHIPAVQVTWLLGLTGGVAGQPG